MPKFRGTKSDYNELLIDVLISSEPFLPNTFGSNKNEVLTFKALIDTGASASVISSSVVEQLEIVPQGRQSIMSASEVFASNLYQVYIGIPITEPGVTRSEVGKLSPTINTHIKQFFLNVTEMPKLADQFDMLLGMDILESCLLIVDDDFFTLAF